MTNNSPTRPTISIARITAIARLRFRRVLRTRILLAALVLALLPWAVVDGTSLVARLSALTTFTVAGLTTLAAGAIGDDLESGEYAIVMTHDATPVEMLGGQAATGLGLTAILVALQLPIALAGTVLPHLVPLLLCIAWLAALLAGWLALMLLLATFLEGKANAVAMIALLFLPLLLAPGLLDRLPHFAAAIVRTALQLLPQIDHATGMFRAILLRAPTPAIAPLVLLASPFIYFALAFVRLQRLEPAGRLAQ